ncbi:uncharacterized protein LOC116341083 [Contarinia nasturtii]|uniref:uncharacterized protein LOC116341083 n=1 Tax=Contarinia nasturtii TaxID=265458 RepID=UPI0012D43BA9|nr:uncharacterized protein LOC116341083 [Contarinia nasturtii]
MRGKSAKNDNRVSRGTTRDNYLCEAYGCSPCFVRTPKLTSIDVARIRRRLVKPQRTQPKRKANSPKNLSPKTKRRRDESLFTPPVPYPVKMVEVQTMNNELHAHIVQIRNEHNYSS